MSGNDRYSRRRLLQAVTGVGIAGTTVGAVTGAYLTDRRTLPGNRSQAGTLDIELAAEDGTSAASSGFADDDFESTTTVPVTFGDLEPGDRGTVRCAFRLCNTRGQVWLRITLDGSTDLGEELTVQVLERPDCNDVAHTRFEGTLTELADTYAGGTLLGDECFGCEQTCVDLAWIFDDNPSSVVAGDRLSVSLEFAAVQCRHNEQPVDPWS